VGSRGLPSHNDQHYFADSSLPSYDEAATALLLQRVLDFLRAR
jgi:dienelactone hydrolase